MKPEPFWRRKSLEEMTDAEWESLCDGCGRCCLVRIMDEESGETGTTGLACRLLDLKTCRCSDYRNRFARVEDCMQLTPQVARSAAWLPDSCAYRRLALGKDLPDWHPLVTGRKSSVREAGISVGSFAISEEEVDLEDEADLWDYVID